MSKMNAKQVLDIVRVMYKHEEVAYGRIMRVILDLYRDGKLENDSMDPVLTYDYLRTCSVPDAGNFGLVDVYISQVCVLYIDLKKSGTINPVVEQKTTQETAYEAAKLMTKIQSDEAVYDMFKTMALFMFYSVEAFGDEHAIESTGE